MQQNMKKHQLIIEESRGETLTWSGIFFGIIPRKDTNGKSKAKVLGTACLVGIRIVRRASRVVRNIGMITFFK